MWALDGRHIYFTSNPNFVLSRIAIGDAAAIPLENPGAFVHFEDVTRDGRYLVFKSLNQEVWTQTVGGTERRALVQGPYAITQPRVSSDSGWLAHVVSLPSGQEVFVQPFDRPGDRINIGKGFGLLWRDDGGELHYESADGVVTLNWQAELP